MKRQEHRTIPFNHINPQNQDKYKDNFIREVSTKDNNITAHMVYMPGCIHCEVMKPIWHDAVNNIKDTYSLLTYIHMDSYNNFMPNKYHVAAFPHLVVHLSSEEQNIYKGPPDVEKVKKWLDNCKKMKKPVFKGGKKMKTTKQKKHKSKKTFKIKCPNMSFYRFSNYIKSKELNNNVFYKQSSTIDNSFHLDNLKNWDHNMKKRYLNIKKKYQIKPNTKKWKNYKKIVTCRSIKTLSIIHKDIIVIGILSIPTEINETGATSFIPQSYVKWAELHGARIMPIQYDLPIPMINYLLGQIHGLLLIGGDLDDTVVSKESQIRYLSSLRHIFNKITDYNLNGNHYPIFSICLNHEILPILGLNNDVISNVREYNHLTHINFVNKSSLNFIPFNKKNKDENLCKHPMSYFTKQQQNFFQKNDVVYFAHNYSFLNNSEFQTKFGSFITVTAEGHIKNKKTVSMYQFTSFPYFGTQFHIEKPLYEWREEGVPHSDEAILLSKTMSKMFMEECKKNYNVNTTIANTTSDKNNLLIENYDLLSRDNTNKILNPHFRSSANRDCLGSCYIFGRTDLLKSEQRILNRKKNKKTRKVYVKVSK